MPIALAAPPQPVDLTGCTLDELEAFARSLGEPAYRGRQLARWIYRRRAATFAEMTDLPAPLRARLPAVARLPRLVAVARQDARSGSTTKVLCALPDGQAVETVLMRYDDGRRTVCISTQVGCGMGCTFCATGLAGLQRNLTAGEIVDQVLLIAQETGERPTHVVFMGMGEPLANYGATVRAVRILNAPWGLGIGMRHLTISTVGLVPQIRRLAAERFQLTLAISLHAPDDALRSQLVPVTRRWPIAALLAAARDYAAATGRRVTFEYVLLAGVNDADGHARALGRLLAGSDSHLNVIPWNPVYGMHYRRPSADAVRRFARIVRAAGVSVTVRVERGVEIDAACGQLRRTRPGLAPAGAAGTGA
jgi:23S rRNA (adenine2503-C2)-methyltransferase